MQLIVPGIIALLVLLGWGAVELDHVIHAYPGQFWMGVFGFLFVIVAAAGLKFRLSRRRPVREPGAMWKTVTAVPVKRAITAAPQVTALASVVPAPAAAACEGPVCGEAAGDEPWSAGPASNPRQHLFCSEDCLHEWMGAHRPAQLP